MKTPVLCVSRNSVYHAMPDVDAYDQQRDARTFCDDRPLIAHPPCRAWSAYTRHQAKPAADEWTLGPMCVTWLRRNGGILEHPAHSKLFEYCRLPRPDDPMRDGIRTVAVWQSWWGYDLRKATWLTFFGINPLDLEFPYVLSAPGGDRRAQQLMSHAQRAETVPAFAQWLVDAVRGGWR